MTAIRPALPKERASSAYWNVGALLVAATVAAGVVVSRAVLLVIPAGAALYALTRPWGRIVWLVAGGFTVFQSSDGFSAPKLVYLAGVAVSLLVALYRLSAPSTRSRTAPFHSALVGAGVLGAVVVVVGVAQLLRGAAGLTDVARDGLTYALIAAGAVIGIDAGGALATSTVRRLAVLTGAAASLSFAVTWLGRRHATTLDAAQFALSSMELLAFGFCAAYGAAIAGPRIRWGLAMLAALFAGSALVTGSRTALALAAAIPAAWAPGGRGPKPRRIVAVGASVLLLVPAVLLAIGSRVVDAGFLAGRLVAATTVLDHGFAADLSGAIRARAYAYAIDAFHASPWFGQGIGATYPSPYPGRGGVGYELDTPALLHAKFGVVGGVVVVVSIVLMLLPTFSRGTLAALEARTVGRAFAAVNVVMIPFGLQIDDKGFALAVALLLAWLVAETHESSRQQPPDPVGEPLDHVVEGRIGP
jgi:hypothetical protein